MSLLTGAVDISADLSPTLDQATISPSRGCVTRQDLTWFRKEVEQAIAEKRIVPTEQDSFDPEDRKYGPNMYTVCEQYIKPVTARAGNVSWALTHHPRGLECDLFISHAWAEGVFEFIDKVLTSWPRGARHAYCCILANPQNLDISAFTSNPRDSPFAQALKSAKWVLVVPNSTGSIYSRIWCTYEAYLAYKWRKRILTAYSPCPGSSRRFLTLVSVGLLVFTFCFAGLGLSTHEFVRSVVLHDTNAVKSICYCLLLLSVSADNHLIVHAVNYITVLMWAMNRAIIYAWIFFCRDHFLKHNLHEWSSFFYMSWAVEVLAVCAFSELDCVYRAEAQLAGRQLRNGYSGHVMDASASDKGDAEKIKQEIREKQEVHAVDRAVDVLIKAGVSTPHLQEADIWGADTAGAAYHNYSKLCLSLIFWFHMSLWIWYTRSGQTRIRALAISAFSQGLTFVAILTCLPLDSRRFATNAASFFVFPCTIVYTFLVFCANGDGSFRVRVAEDILIFSIACLTAPLTLGVSLISPATLCRVPLVGVVLTNLILGSGFPSCAVYNAQQASSPAGASDLEMTSLPQQWKRRETKPLHL